MQPKLTARNLIGLWGLAIVLLVSSCTQFEGIDPSQDESEDLLAVNADGNLINAMVGGPVVNPILWTAAEHGNGGNATCAEVCEYDQSSGRNNFEYGAFANSWPEGLEVKVSPDGKYITWSFTPPEGKCLEGMAVIVKGSNASHIYVYPQGVNGDSGLHSPYTGGKKPNIAQLSNLTFCYSLSDAPEAPEAEDRFAEYCEGDAIAPLCAEATAPEGSMIVWYTSETGDELATETCLTDFGSLELWAASVKYAGCESAERTKVSLLIDKKGDCGTVYEEEMCYKTETAWGGNSSGEGKAWWFYFDAEAGPATQTIYAGQKATDGTVTYDGSKITINLGSWSLQNDSEAVKIQGYNEIPSTRPAAGPFTTYKGTALEIQVSGFRYYAIHLDVKQAVACEQ